MYSVLMYSVCIKSEKAYEALMAGFLETMNEHVAEEFERLEHEMGAKYQSNQLC